MEIGNGFRKDYFSEKFLGFECFCSNDIGAGFGGVRTGQLYSFRDLHECFCFHTILGLTVIENTVHVVETGAVGIVNDKGSHGVMIAEGGTE